MHLDNVGQKPRASVPRPHGLVRYPRFYGRCSLHFFDVAGLPTFVDGGFGRRVEPEYGKIPLTRHGGEPVSLFSFRFLGADVEVRAAVSVLHRLVART